MYTIVPLASDITPVNCSCRAPVIRGCGSDRSVHVTFVAQPAFGICADTSGHLHAMRESYSSEALR